jgi:hypothetical protein
MDEKQAAATSMHETTSDETTSDTADVIQAILPPPRPEHQRQDSHAFLDIRVLKSNHLEEIQRGANSEIPQAILQRSLLLDMSVLCLQLHMLI